MGNIQLNGGMEFGTDPEALDAFTGVSKAVLHLTANKVSTKPTYDNPIVSTKPGAKSGTIEIVASSDENDADSLQALLVAAYASGAPVFWAGKYKAGAASASNHRWEGSFYVSDIDVGTAVGEELEISRTFDLIEWVGPLTTDPT